jgi:WD40 repeat protein
VRLSESANFSLFTNDGRWLILGTTTGIEIWDLETRGLLHTVETPSVTALALSPDDEQLIVGTNRGTIYVIDTRTGFQRFVLNGHGISVTDLDYSPTARQVISGDRSGVAFLWDVETGRMINQLPEPQGNEIVKVTFNENGSAAYSYSLTFRSERESRPARIGVFNPGLPGAFRNPPEYRGFSPNGRIAYNGGDGTNFLKFFDADSMVEQRTFRLGNADTDYIEPIAFSDDGRYILIESESRNYNNERTSYNVLNRYIALWEIATGGEIRRFSVNVDDPRAWDVTSLAFSPDNNLALVGGRFNTINTVTLWDVNTGEELRRFTGHTAPIEEVMFSSDGSYGMSRSSDGNVRIWDIGRIELNIVNRTRVSADTLDAFGLSADGNRAYVAVNDRSMTTYDITSNEEVRGVDVFTGDVILSAFNPTQPQALIVAVDSVVLYDLVTTQRIHVFSDLTPSEVRAVAFSPDGQYLFYAVGSRVYRWEIASRSIFQTINAGVNGLRYLAPSSNNEFLAMANQNSIQVYDLITNEVIQNFSQNSGPINSLEYSPNGDSVLTAIGEPGNTVVVWDLRTGLPRYTLIGHTAAVNVARYSPDGLAALSGGDDLGLILWDLTSGQAIREYSGHTAPVRQIIFNPQVNAAHSISSVLADGIITWRVDSIGDTVNWVYANRYIREIDCLERLQYGVKPECEGNIIPTPQPTPTSQATATPLPSATPRPTMTPTNTPIPTAQIATDGSLVNVRSGAGAGFSLVTQAQNGTVVQVLEVLADIGWVQIRLPDGTIGWVQRGVLR